MRPIIERVCGVYEPHVYIVEEVSSTRLYIGSRTLKRCLDTDIGTKYFTSSKRINIRWKADRSAFRTVQIIKCDSNHTALELEGFMIDECDAVKSPQYINEANGGHTFNNSGRPHSDAHKVKISIANTGKVLSLESRAKISAANSGTVHVANSEGVVLTVSVDDRRLVTGEYTALSKGRSHTDEFKQSASARMKGKVSAKDSDGNTYLVNQDDPRYTSGELVPVCTGRIISDETKAKISISNKGKYVSDETRMKMSIANTGKVLSDQSKNRISKAHTGKVLSETTRAKISAANKGKTRTLEQNAVNSAMRLGSVKSDDAKAKASTTMSQTVWVHNDNLMINKRINKDLISEWLADGWILGQIRYKKD